MIKPNGHVLLLLDGDEPSRELLLRNASASRMIVATDGAARIAQKYDLDLDVIIGDMDSLDDSTKQYYERKQTSIIANPDQYSNDFEKALNFLIVGGFTDSIVILGLHGKRTDHTLTNLSTLVRYRDRFRMLMSLDNYQTHYLLTERYSVLEISQEIGNHVSLTPLPQADGVTTTGLFYPISREGMLFGDREGLSNILTTSNASVRIESGSLLISIAHRQ